MQSTEWLLYTLNFSKQQCECYLLVSICLKLLKVITLCHSRTLDVHCTCMEHKTVLVNLFLNNCLLGKLRTDLLNRISLTIVQNLFSKMGVEE